MRPHVILCSHSPRLNLLWQSEVQGNADGTRVTTLRELLEKLERYQKVTLILDLSLPEIRDPQTIKLIHSKFPDSRILAIADNEDEKEIAALFSAGVKGYCRSNIKAQLFRKAVAKINDGEIWLERHLICTILSEITRQPPPEDGGAQRHVESLLDELTRRERQVAALVSEGLCQKAIASHLVISEHTVRNHLRNIFHKTGATSRLQLAIMIRAEG